jgi:hypothetical protein
MVANALESVEAGCVHLIVAAAAWKAPAGLTRAQPAPGAPGWAIWPIARRPEAHINVT